MKKKLVLPITCLMLALVILFISCSGAASTDTPEDRPYNVELTILGFITGTTFQLRADAIAEDSADHPSRAMIDQQLKTGRPQFVVGAKHDSRVNGPVRPGVDF